MSAAQEQCFLDVISRETTKLMNLKNTLNLEQEKIHTDAKVKDRAPFYVRDESDDKDKREQIQFMREIQRERDEKQCLLQAVISEAAASGFPLTPSFIKLMENQNCK